MSLYTSSSNKGFITGAIMTMLLLFVAYSFVAPRLFPNGGGAQNQWQDNVIKAQKYIYGKEDPPYVIAGSSLSARMLPPSLPTGYYNFSLSGGSLFTGVDVVLKSSRVPEVLLIETNVIMRAGDEKFIKNLFSPITHLMRTYLPVTQDQFQPIVFGSPLLNMLLTSVGFFGADDFGSKQQQGNIFDIGLKRQQASHSKLPDVKILYERTDRLKRTVASLRKKGVRVVFFEMPVHPSLYDTPKTILEKEFLLTAFPMDKYDWIPFPNPAEYQTVDGIHLDPESARKYTAFLIAELQRITKKGLSFSEN